MDKHVQLLYLHDNNFVEKASINTTYCRRPQSMTRMRMPLSLEDLERVESVGERQACLKAASCTSTAGDSPRALGSSHDCGEAHYLPLPPKLYLSPSTRSTLFRPFSSAARSTGPNHQVKNTPMQNEVEGRRQSKRRRAATCIGQVSSVLPPGRLPARGVAIEKEIQTVLNGTILPRVSSSPLGCFLSWTLVQALIASLYKRPARLRLGGPPPSPPPRSGATSALPALSTNSIVP